MATSRYGVQLRFRVTAFALLVLSCATLRADEEVRYAKTRDGKRPTPIVAVDNVTAWPNLTVLPDGEIIASIFNLPAFKLNGAESSSTKSNMEEQNRSYYQTSLARWTNRFTEEAERKLLRDDESRSGEHFFRWFPEAFLRGDLKSRSEAYGFAIRDRWMNPNEVRAKEDMNSYEGGDEFLNPAIDTAGGGDGDGDDDDGNREAVENLMRERTAKLLDIESNLILAEATKSKNFRKWVEGFYDGYPALAVDVMGPVTKLSRELGVSTNGYQPAYRHAESSKRTLLMILDSVGEGKGLVAAVKEFADANRANVDILLKQIMEQDNGTA